MLWVNELDQCGDAGWLVLLAKSLGCAGLIVKAWDGETYLPQCEQVIKLAHACGLLVIAWGYNYGQNIPGEVAAIVKAVQSGQADGLILDVEEEFEAASGQAMAENLLSLQALSAMPALVLQASDCRQIIRHSHSRRLRSIRVVC
jgi:hypothetical protein